MAKRIQKLLFIAVFSFGFLFTSNAQTLDSLEITFSVNLAVQQELGVYDPGIHTPAIAANFTDWGTGAVPLVDQVDTTFSGTFLFEDLDVDSVLEYKFVLLDGGNITWEDGGNYLYTVSGTESDSDGNGVPDSTIYRFFNDIDYSELDSSEEYDVTFSVNLHLMESEGLFDANTQVVKVVGAFNGWNTAEGIVMNEDSPNSYSATVRILSENNPDSVYYKFILDDGDVTWDEPLAIVNPNGGNDRLLLFDGTETDDNADGIDDVVLETVDFSDLGPEFIGSVANAIDTPDGDSINFVGTVTRAFESFLFIQQDTAGIYTFNSSGAIYEGIINGDIRPGDFVEVAALSGSFEGLQAFGDTDLLRVVYRDVALPEPIHLTAEEFNNSGTRYNSELIKIENLRIDEATEFTGSTSFNVIEDATGTSITLFNRGDNGSEVRGPIPGLFDYIGVAGYFGPNSPPNQLTPTYVDDIIDVSPVIPIPEPPYAVGDTINYNGSFALFDLGTDLIGDGWFFDNVNGPSTYEIVDDSQDGDSRAAKATINFTGDPGAFDPWRAQIVNEPIKPSAGDLIRATFWMKGTTDGMTAEAFFGLPEAGGFEDVVVSSFGLTTDWQEYEVSYLVSDFAADVGLRFGLKLNFPENDQQMVYLDNVQLVKQEVIITDLNFSVNVGVQADLGNFDPSLHSVGVVGAFNGWDTDSPIFLTAENDSVYSATAEAINVAIGDTLEYKFILKDNEFGNFEWESIDPSTPNTSGDFVNRVVGIDDLTSVTVPTVYFHGIDRNDLDVDNYGISSISEARNSPIYTHMAIQGIVTRTTRNFVYMQDETGGIMLFSRPWFGEFLAIGFNEAVANGEIQVGDELRIAGVIWDFNGLHELTRLHAWEVVSSGNPLPAAQVVDIDEYSLNGEEYESEIVRVEYVRILDPVDSLFGGFIYEITNEDESQIGWMSIQGGGNSDWDGMPAPQGFFNLQAVVKEFFIPALDGNIYAIAVHDINDIHEIPADFEAEFVLDPFAGLVNTTEGMPIRLVDLGNEPIQGMEFSVVYDPSAVSLTLGDQTGIIADGLDLVTNDVGGRLNIAFATDGTPENDVSEVGTFMNFNLDLLSNGETEILVTDILVNEKPLPDFGVIINIVPRLCGDVSGDDLVSALDASFVLQHTVKIADVFPLIGLDSTAADVTGNGDISAFDASWILQRTVGVRDNLGCITLPLKEEPKPAIANWTLKSTENGNNEVELNFGRTEFEIYAIQLELEGGDDVTFKRITNLPDAWNMVSNTTEGVTHLSLYGTNPIDQNALTMEFSTSTNGALPKLKGQVSLNETVVPEMDDLLLGDVPSEFALNQNYPNPFNPSTNISYTLPEMSQVDLTIYNMLGQKVATLVNQTQEAGSYTISWEAGNASSGVYIYRLTAGNQTFTKRMMLIK